VQRPSERKAMQLAGQDGFAPMGGDMYGTYALLCSRAECAWA
jgi:hypothetical protein